MITKMKTLQVLISLFCLFVSGMATCDAASAGETNAKTAYDFYVSGNRLYHENKYDEAIDAFEKSVQRDPDFYFSRVNLGVAMAKKRQFRQAVQQFTFCIDEKYGSETDRFVFYFNRILAGSESGPAPSAQKDRAALKKLDPTRAGALRHSTDYIFMDTLYTQRRNAADKGRLFQENKASIARGKVVVRKIAGHRKNAEEYEAMGLIEGTLEQVTGVLADYESYPEFMPNVKDISIKSNTDEGFVVDHTLGLPMGFVKQYRLKYWAKREENRIQLFWKKLPWPGLKLKETVIDTYGQWILEGFPGKDNQVLAYYRIYTDPGKIPFGTGWIIDIVTKESIPNVIKETRRRVKRMTQ